MTGALQADLVLIGLMFDCLDQPFLIHCHINVTLLSNMEEINKGTKEGTAMLPKRRGLSPHWNVLK